MERFEEAVPLYLKACEVEGKTERTVQSYDETLRHFRRAVDQLQLPNSVRAFGPAHVYLFMGWVRDRGVSAGTQHRRQREVKAFFSWCRRSHVLFLPPSLGADRRGRASPNRSFRSLQLWVSSRPVGNESQPHEQQTFLAAA